MIRKTLLPLLTLPLLAFLALNAIAFMQARSMTHFVSAGQRTAKPEQMGFMDKIRVILTGVELPRPENLASPKEVGLAYTIDRISVPNHAETLEAWQIPAPNSQGLVLLFPPYGSSKASLLAPAKIFHQLGYDALLVDYRGVGGSGGNDTTLGVREAEDVAIAFTHAQKFSPQGKPIILYGASMGAVAVMRAVAIEKIQPAGLILESPFDRLLTTVRHRFEAMGIPSFPSAELIVFWGGVQQGIDGFGHNPVDYGRSIPCPVLLLHGELDQRVAIADATRVFKSLPGKKQWRVFAGANGHGSLAMDDGELWRELASRFLKDIP